MSWELEWSEKGFVVEASIERGLPPPEWSINEPYVPPPDQFFFSAFWELSTCRSLGWSIGPIPWRDVVVYAEYHGLDEDLIPVFIGVIRAMDSAYLRWLNKKK